MEKKIIWKKDCQKVKQFNQKDFTFTNEYLLIFRLFFCVKETPFGRNRVNNYQNSKIVKGRIWTNLIYTHKPWCLSSNLFYALKHQKCINFIVQLAVNHDSLSWWYTEHCILQLAPFLCIAYVLLYN